ncbi:hypothetical protein VA596_00455 [Amycolatopsis sp., V23-08]|uniref:MFS transporter n=1 Tax=Amycolatopsis heterodermiae TaxID=3110235 RepID=A0ABU5QVN6_9PSEU|nr:hypothetical protein [Amycolatopsis sp., V23-08]MEA5357988.1 hypothetical protein [Amycolatopsis sp., V23-08]
MMPIKQYRPCAVVAGDPPSLTARRATIWMMAVFVGFGSSLSDRVYVPVLIAALLSIGMTVEVVAPGMILVLRMQLRGRRHRVEPAGEM